MEQPTVIQYLPPDSLVEHPEASRIPEMNPDEWTDFLESVRVKNIVTDPVFALPDGRIFDGRHRLRAAKECSLRLIPVIFYNIDEVEALLRMKDCATMRRSLTTGQKVAIQLEFSELIDKLREEARESQGRRTDLLDFPEGFQGSVIKTGEVAKVIAEISGTSDRSVYALQAVQRSEPDIFQKVKSGEYTINKAQTEMKKRKRAEESGSQDNIIKFPRKKTRNREKLDEIVAVTPVTSRNYSDGQPNDFSPDGILQYRYEKEFPEYITRLVADHAVLSDAREDSITEYLNKAKRVAEGLLLILADYESDMEIREIYNHIAGILHKSRQAGGNEVIKQFMGGNL